MMGKANTNVFINCEDHYYATVMTAKPLLFLDFTGFSLHIQIFVLP